MKAKHKEKQPPLFQALPFSETEGVETTIRRSLKNEYVRRFFCITGAPLYRHKEGVTKMGKKGLGELRTNSIEIEFDEETQDYYIIWNPIVIGSGKTREEALEDLKGAAHYGVDTLIDLKLRDMRVSG